MFVTLLEYIFHVLLFFNFFLYLFISDDSSDDEDNPRKGKRKEEKEADIGKVVCVELGDKKKQKDNWFPGLVVAPTAQDTVRIRVRDEYLVRSFKDGR
jgi:Ras-related protein Rab-1A